MYFFWIIYQNSNTVLESHHNIPHLLFLPLLQLSCVIKHYLKNFKNRNRAESSFSIQMSLFKLTVIVVKIALSSSSRGKQRGYSSQEYDNCWILLEESQKKHLQVCVLQLTWTLHFIQHLSKAHSHVSRHFCHHSNESLQNKDKILKTSKTHSHLATHSSSSSTAVHPALAACEIQKPEHALLGHLPSLHWANKIYQRSHSVCVC